MNGASQNITLTVTALCPFLPIYANLRMDIATGPLKSHMLEIRVWMIVTFVCFNAIEETSEPCF